MTATPTQIQQHTDHYILLETIAACLREEGLPAVTKRRLCIHPTEIAIVKLKPAPKGIFNYDRTETLYTITLQEDNLTLWEDEPWYNLNATPIATIPLADPQAFHKIKKLAPCPPLPTKTPTPDGPPQTGPDMIKKLRNQWKNKNGSKSSPKPSGKKDSPPSPKEDPENSPPPTSSYSSASTDTQ